MNKIKPLYEYELFPMTDRQFQLLETIKNAAIASRTDLENPMFEYFRVRCEMYQLELPVQLMLFVVNTLGVSVVALDMYAHAIYCMSLKEESPVIRLKDFMRYFKNGFPNSFSLRAAWDAQKDGLMNQLENGGI